MSPALLIPLWSVSIVRVEPPSAGLNEMEPSSVTPAVVPPSVKIDPVLAKMDPLLAKTEKLSKKLSDVPPAPFPTVPKAIEPGMLPLIAKLFPAPCARIGEAAEVSDLPR